MMDKYQFHIAYNDKANTAGSKAVQDCKSILLDMGYLDYGIEDIALTDSFYVWKLLARIIKFFFVLKPGSIVAIQYPLLSGNSLFKHFIKAAHAKGVRFFCIVHDLDDLRYSEAAHKESEDVRVLNCYDYIIVHNAMMKEWLLENNLTPPVIILHAFDYLSVINTTANVMMPGDLNTIVFAGNLSKSRFVYALDVVDQWYFNLYGPNYLPEKACAVKNICWNGSLSPDEIVTGMTGSFGLIWDGEYIDQLDTMYGNYLKYNYPHKLSLYLAAGMPVIAPTESAVSNFIKEHRIGILVNNLLELRDVSVNEEEYALLKSNVAKISDKIKTGGYLADAVTEVEADIFMRMNNNNYKTNTLYN